MCFQLEKLRVWGFFLLGLGAGLVWVLFWFFFAFNVVRKYSSLTTDFSGVLNLKKRTLAQPRKVEHRENWWKHSGK